MKSAGRWMPGAQWFRVVCTGLAYDQTEFADANAYLNQQLREGSRGHFVSINIALTNDSSLLICTMARSLRIERTNGVYHVINRGNYRQDLFTNEGAPSFL